MTQDDISRLFSRVPGRTALYFRDLTDGTTLTWNPDEPLIAASVIKLGLMGALYQRFEAGLSDPDARVTVTAADMTPGSGILSALSPGIRPTLRDLCAMMIAVSDNTATNMLFDHVGGAGAINAFLRSRGLTSLSFNRKMYDDAAAARGVQNRITAAGVGALLEMLYRGELVSPAADKEMLTHMMRQQFNHKIPFYLGDIDIAHKTGEDDGTTHDAAIVFAKKPFVLCVLSNDTDVPAFERLMQDVARDLALPRL